MNTLSTSWRAERRAAPKRARIPSGAEPGHEQSGGLFVPGEGLGLLAQRGLQGRPGYSPDEGSTRRAERRAAPKRARIPSGDRPGYSPDEGST
jgi:hypothetical protein